MREIDLPSNLAHMLLEFIGQRTSGFLFQSRTGEPLCQTNVLKRSLHPILESMKHPKAGFHAFRRFRVSWLRKNRAPEDLIRFWLGHANQTVTDGYSKLSGDTEFRKECAEKMVLVSNFLLANSVLYPLYRKTKGLPKSGKPL